MTNEELQAHIAAIKVAYDAGLIEEVDTAEGNKIRDPRHSFGGGICLFDAELTYRIKPQPREVMVRIYDDGSVGAAFDPDKGLPSGTTGKLVKFREVIE